jgi:hypothetical protein
MIVPASSFQADVTAFVPERSWSGPSARQEDEEHLPRPLMLARK